MIATPARIRALRALFPPEVTLSLHTSEPGGTGAGELRGAGYERVPMAYAVDARAVLRNSEPCYFLRLPAAVVVAIGVWDAATGEFVRGERVPTQRVQAGGAVLIEPAALAFMVTSD